MTAPREAVQAVIDEMRSLARMAQDRGVEDTPYVSTLQMARLVERCQDWADRLAALAPASAETWQCHQCGRDQTGPVNFRSWRGQEGQPRHSFFFCSPTCHEHFWAAEANAAPSVPAPSTGETQGETCICAAVRTTEGPIIRGQRHSDAMTAARQAFCTPQRGEESQGFITSTGRFVTRREGRQLQEAAGLGSRSPGGYRSDLLFSEDLY